MKKDIKDWIDNDLIVTAYPNVKNITEGELNNYDVFINVSDEYWMDYVNVIWENKKQSHWFPMGENANDMGLVSMFGALWVLYQSYQKGLKVVLHCHAGINRSQTVRSAFYYMMIGEHNILNGFEKQSNMLQLNCKQGHLPEIEKMEAWLKLCKTAFYSPNSFLGGMYDWTLRKSGINK